MSLTAKEAEFLKELEALSHRLGIQIDGCGCCSSPGIVEIESENLLLEAGYVHDDCGGCLKWVPNKEIWIAQFNDNAVRYGLKLYEE